MFGRVSVGVGDKLGSQSLAIFLLILARQQGASEFDFQFCDFGLQQNSIWQNCDFLVLLGRPLQVGLLQDGQQSDKPINGLCRSSLGEHTRVAQACTTITHTETQALPTCDASQEKSANDGLPIMSCVVLSNLNVMQIISLVHLTATMAATSTR